jgi:hypothetical protein
MLLALLLAQAVAAPVAPAAAVAAPAPAAQNAPPRQAQAADPDQLLDPEDYPQFALVRDLSAAAPVELFISPQGHAMDCNAAKGWGDAQLAETMCDILLHKHLTPARLADGTPAYSVVRGLARLFIPGTRDGDAILRLEPPADLELEAPHLPGGLARTPVNLLLTVAPAGTVADCAPGKDETQLDLVQLICPALRGLKPGQRVGNEGAGVPYVMTLRAMLSAKDAPPPAPEAPDLPQ